MVVLGVAARCRQSLAPRRHPGANLVGRMGMAHGHDVVAVAAGPTQSLRRGARHPDERQRLLHGTRVQGDLLEPPEVARMAEAFPGPRLDDDVMGFLVARPPLLLRRLEDTVVQGRVAQADAELQSSAGHRVHHGVVLGHLQRMAHAQDGDARAEANPGRPGRGRRQHHRGVGDEAAVAQEMVLVEHEALEPQLLGQLDLLQHLPVVDLVRRIDVRVVGGEDVDVEPHGVSP